MELLVELINQKEISESSKKVYISLLKRMTKLKFKIPMKDSQESKRVSAFIDTFDNPNSKLDFLNLIIVLRNIKELPVDKLKELRIKFKQVQKTHQVDKLKDVGDKLISYEMFKEKLDKAFEEEQYKKYIVNYLMMNYGVRNKDLNLTIIKAKKDIEPKNNYLLIKKDGIKYIRDDYKTHSKYGTQTHDITDDKFIFAVKKVGFGKLLDANQISNALKLFKRQKPCLKNKNISIYIYWLNNMYI
ncbi:MAG: hypothetical protein ACO3UU_05635 [Minisyncoccia bacterium]